MYGCDLLMVPQILFFERTQKNLKIIFNSIIFTPLAFKGLEDFHSPYVT